MKILLVHNHYQSASPSGEDVAFDNDRLLLAQAGHEVETYTRHNDSIGNSALSRAGAAASLFWSDRSYRDISRLLAEFRPDVAHFHNTFPLISISGYRACREHGLPVVQTLHNYRLVCPGGLLQRDGKPCEKCIEGSLVSAVQYGCYRQSRAATALVAGMLSVNRLRGVYSRDVDRYLCLTAFARQRFLRAGFPAHRLIVRANGLPNPPQLGRGDGGFALFVGRLRQEKGVETLIRAWKDVPYPLKIVGDGPLRSDMETLARTLGINVTFEGLKERADVAAFMQSATLLIIPSECYEGFPVTVLEGLATGVPLVVSALGALDELIDAPTHGVKFTPGDPIGLRAAATGLLADPAARLAMRLANRTLFDTMYSPATALQSLEKIYGHLTSERQLEPMAPASA
jgi:glycosyltransferase involved in cell wall biosynthesis